MRPTVNDFQAGALSEAGGLVGAVKFVRLVDGDLWILVAVDQEKRGIVGINVEDRRSKSG